MTVQPKRITPYHLAFLVGAVFAATAALLSAVLLRPGRQVSAREGEKALEAAR